MKPSLRLYCALAALLAAGLTLSSCVTEKCGTVPDNQLTASEKKAGWKLLFDGQSLNGWRSYGKPAAPDHGWVATNGTLNCVAGGHGGDLITTEQIHRF